MTLKVECNEQNDHAMKAQTRDIGFAIRDFLEERTMSVFTDSEGHGIDLCEYENERHINVIDASEPDNPGCLSRQWPTFSHFCQRLLTRRQANKKA
jgi:hypothetical protein